VIGDSRLSHCRVATLGKLLMPMCLGSWYRPRSGWEGNCRSGVTLAMRDSVVYPPMGYVWAMSTPPYAPMEHDPFTYFGIATEAFFRLGGLTVTQ